MDITDESIAAVEAEDAALVLAHFDNDDAWWLGNRIRELAAERQLAIGFEIMRGTTSLLRGLLPGAVDDNYTFLTRKIALTARFGKASFAVSLKFWRDPALVERWALDTRLYALTGGALPLRIAGTGIVGAFAVSGAPPHIDHRLAVDALGDLIQHQNLA
ncbi:heme-binding protein [Novosphingobium sp.]|uniref:heme-binding protein n=1 Tax=Novosphingobium sp. TaxID=1874826 RepID=UPI003D143C4B